MWKKKIYQNEIQLHWGTRDHRCVIKVKIIHNNLCCYHNKTTALCYLSRSLHTLPEAEVYDGENEKKAEHQLPADTPNIFQPRRLVDLKNIPPVTTKHINHAIISTQENISRTKSICVEYYCKAIYICGFCNSHLHALTCKIPRPETWRNSSR